MPVRKSHCSEDMLVKASLLCNLDKLSGSSNHMMLVHSRYQRHVTGGHMHSNTPCMPAHACVCMKRASHGLLLCRPDVLPVPVMAELARLQDNITPFNTDAARAVIEADLGQPIDAIFSEFSAQPIAAASLAQAGVPSQFVTEHM